MDDVRKIDSAKLLRRALTFLKSERIRELSSVVFIVALASTMLFRCLRGDWPIGHDHPVHLFRIWQLGETLRHHPFSPWTWSHRWFAGYPQNVVYPIGADLFVLAFRALSFGALSLGRAYGLTFWVFYCLYGYAIYFFVRSAFASRAAGLFAAIFLLTDPGSNDVGGWFYTVDVGVWASAFATVFGLIAIAQSARLFDKPEPKRAAVVAACVGVALLSHPLSVVLFGLAVPLLCLSRYLTGEPTEWRSSLIMVALAVAVGVLIGSYWLGPYIAASPYALQLGVHGANLEKIGGALSGAKLFDRMNAFAAVLGFVGAICLLRSRRTLPLFISIFIFCAIIASSSNFTGLFGHGAEPLLAKYFIAPRMLMLAKPFWYAGAAFFLVECWRIVEWPGNNLPRLRLWSRALLAVILLGPLGYYFITTFLKWEVERPTFWNSARGDLDARKDFIRWMQSSDRQGGFFRIAHDFDWNEHNLADLAIDIPRPFYKVGPTPTGHFKYQIYSSSNATFRAINVRFALSHTPLPPRADLQLRQVFRQQLWLYEFRDWNPQPFEITGSGQVDLLKFSDDEIVVQANENAHGLLRLNVSNYPKWQATRDDVAVPISTATLPAVENSGFIQVSLAPGTYRFRYTKTFVDYIGTFLSAIGLIACGILATWPRLAAAFLVRPVSKRPPSANEQGGEKRQEQ